MFVLTNTPKEFIPSIEEGKDNPLTFIVKPPTKKAVLDMQERIFKSISEIKEEPKKEDSLIKKDEKENISLDAIPLSEMMNLYLDACVIGWKNVVDSEGNEIPFSKEVFEGFYDSTILIELYNYCRELTESTEKN